MPCGEAAPTITEFGGLFSYRNITAMDAWGYATLVYEGGRSASTAAVILARGYDQATGLALSTEAGRANAAPLVHLLTTWDGFGNLEKRTDQVNGSTEAASYDALNRLAGSTTTLTGGASLTRSYRYDGSGNRTRACSGSTCSVYTYGTNGAGPHAVSAVNGNSGGYAYNASGEMTKDNGRSLTWSAFGQATRITRGNTTVTIGYGPGNRRTRKTVTGPLNETVTYLGSAERLDINGRVSIRRTLALAGIAIIDTGGAQSKRLYPITDHLGSTIAIADSSGHLVQGLAYADFGQRYSAGWGAALTTAQALAVNTTLSDRGYTGQESLDAIGLDDYNARLYDPALGRFLSVDPLIGHPGSTQAINPYSYVENNPLNKTDPTGECVNLVACSLVNGPQGTKMGPKEVQGAVNKAEKHGLSKSVGDLLEKAYHGGAHLSSIAPNATGNTNVNDGTSLGNKKPNAAGGVSAAKLAQLSACSSNPNCQGVGGYRRNYAGLPRRQFVDTGSGFMAALFTNSATRQNVLSYASTDPLSWGDDKNDLEQEFGFDSKQYGEAIRLARVVRRVVGANLTLTGFSLGAGEASAGALAIQAHAATFDAPGLSSYTIRHYRLDLSHANELITA